jgi:hypothetical protein
MGKHEAMGLFKTKSDRLKPEKLNTRILQLESQIEALKSERKIYKDGLYEIVRMGRVSGKNTLISSIRQKYAGFADTILCDKKIPSSIVFDEFDNII